MGLKFTKGNIVYHIPFRNVKKETNVLNGFENIIIAFLYDLCLQHTWNKKGWNFIFKRGICFCCWKWKRQKYCSCKKKI